jgi:hypothetical protein
VAVLGVHGGAVLREGVPAGGLEGTQGGVQAGAAAAAAGAAAGRRLQPDGCGVLYGSVVLHVVGIHRNQHTALIPCTVVVHASVLT